MSSRLDKIMAKGPEEMTEEDYAFLTEAQLADWQYAHMDELDAIEGEPVEFEVSPNLSLVMSFRLSGEEAEAIRLAAKAAGMTLSEWIRSACADAIRADTEDGTGSGPSRRDRHVARTIEEAQARADEAVESLRRFSETFADLRDPEIMRRAWE